MDPQWEQVNRIVDTALELDKEKRKDYIEEQSGKNRELKTQVAELLESIEKSDTEDFLEGSDSYPKNLIADLSNRSDSSDDKSALIGETINNYKITKLIGHGGMGSVFLAKCADEAYRKKVAVKVLRRGMDTPSNIARFKRERKILAKLDHPNIARMLDGGMTNEGLPYLVMEFVEGTPLFTYCDDNKLSFEERIQLFKSISEAVQHAHNNAVIHRDLKPSNILVTEDRQIKILDFGIAKLLEPNDPDINLFETQTGARILTLGYAAPEQVQSRNITTATDTYTLGTLLYELLAGVHPFEIGEKISDAEQLILEKTPPKPSVRFGNLEKDYQQSIADNRKLPADKLVKFLQGDLDAIIMKALRKEPESRYESVGQLMEDLERREQNLPILAHKDSLQYKTKKFFKRHTAGLSVAAGFILLMTGFITFYTWQITEERNLAKTEAQKAEQVTAFLTDLIESNYPENAQGDTITVRDFLNRGYNRVQKLDGSPEVKANIMQVMAQTYRTLGEVEKAGPLINQTVTMYDTLNTQPVERAEAYNLYGLILRDQGEVKEAENKMKQAMSFYQSAGLTQDEKYARLLANLAYVKRINANYEEALSLAEDALDIEKTLYDDANVKLAETYYILASILRKQDKYEQAKKNQLKSLNMLHALVDGPHPGVANNYNNLAIIYEEQDSLQKSGHYYRQSLNMNKDLFGSSHQEIANTASNYSKILLRQNKTDSAELMIKKALKITGNELGKDHPRMGQHLNDYADIFEQRNMYEKADSLHTNALKILKEYYPDDHPKVIGVLHNKAANAYRSGNLNLAEQLLREVLGSRQERLEPSNEDIQIPLIQLINILETKEKPAEIDSLQNLFATEHN